MTPEPQPEGSAEAPTPWWAKSAWTLGPLAVAFLIMLAAVLGWVPSRIWPSNGLDGKKAEAIVEFKTEWRGHMEQTGQLIRLVEDLVRLERQICRSVAKTETGMEGCNR